MSSGFIVKPPTISSGVFNPSFYESSDTSTYLKISGGIVTGPTTFQDDLSVAGQLSIGGTSVNASVISGVSAGSATASKALVLDSSRSASGLSSLAFTNTTGTDCIILRQSPASCATRLYNSDSGGLIGTTTAHPFYIQTNSSIRFYITADGKMGNLTTPAYTMDIRGTVRGESVLASSSTTTPSPPAGELWSYKPTQSAGTGERHISYGRLTDDSNYSHYSFRSIYYGAGSLSNHTVWSANGWNQGMSMTQRGQVMIAAGSGYGAYEATEAALHVRGFVSQTIGAGYMYASNGAYSAGGGGVNLSLRITHDALFEGKLYVTSDERLKKNIRKLEDSDLMKVLELEPIEYDWKSDKGTLDTTKTFGFSAQQVMRVLPRLVSLVPNKDLEEVRDEDGNVIIPDKCQLVMPLHNMIPYLAGVCRIQQDAIKKLIDRVDELTESVRFLQETQAKLNATQAKLVSRPAVKNWLAKQSST